MRILVVTWGFPRRDQRFLVTKVNALARRGHAVTVLCAPGDAQMSHELAPGVRIRPALRERPRSPFERLELVAAALVRDTSYTQRVLATSGGRLIGRLRSLDHVLPFAGEQPDLVHFEFANWAAAHLDALPHLGCPTVVTCHGSDLRVEPLSHPSLRRRLGALFARVDRVVCVSSDLARTATVLGADRSRITVISEGVDTDFFTPPSTAAGSVPERKAGSVPERKAVSVPERTAGSVPERTTIAEVHIVSVGRLHWVKGYEYALQAVHRLRARGIPVTYSIAGHDEGAGDAIRLARRDLGLESAVRLVGDLPPVGVRNLLASADIFLLPSLSEGLCMAAIEAMAMGLPVVTTSVGGMPEAVSDGRTGLVVPPRDPVATADALEALTDDRDRRLALGAAAAIHARRYYDVGHQVDRLVDVFAQLVDQR